MLPAVIDANARQRAEEYDVRLTSVQDPISTLSGGNQQKVVVAREMSRPLRVLIASQPKIGKHTSELQSRGHLVCRLLLEKKNNRPAMYSSRECMYDNRHIRVSCCYALLA